MIRRVVKVGGSLLLRDDLPSALTSWLRLQSPAQTLVLVGGGELIDAIRRLDKIRPANAVATHWLCVDLLDTTFELFGHWFPWPRIATEADFRNALKSGFSVESPTLIAVSSFYQRDATIGNDDLPHDWRTTTDSIAGVLAQSVDADELVLLKSCDVPCESTLDELIGKGIVDEAFAALSLGQTVIRVEKLDAADNQA